MLKTTEEFKLGLECRSWSVVRYCYLILGVMSKQRLRHVANHSFIATFLFSCLSYEQSSRFQSKNMGLQLLLPKKFSKSPHQYIVWHDNRLFFLLKSQINPDFCASVVSSLLCRDFGSKPTCWTHATVFHHRICRAGTSSFKACPHLSPLPWFVRLAKYSLMCTVVYENEHSMSSSLGWSPDCCSTWTGPFHYWCIWLSAVTWAPAAVNIENTVYADGDSVFAETLKLCKHCFSVFVFVFPCNTWQQSILFCSFTKSKHCWLIFAR